MKTNIDDLQMVKMIRVIDPDVYKQFQINCIKNNVTYSEQIMILMKDWIKSQSKKGE